MEAYKRPANSVVLVGCFMEVIIEKVTIDRGPEEVVCITVSYTGLEG